MSKITIFWFRRDLRLDDNHGLYQALKASKHVLPIFIFDTEILKKLPLHDLRIPFIHQTVQSIKAELNKIKSDCQVFYGNPIEIFKTIDCAQVYTNRDYEPYAINRDKSVAKILKTRGIEFHTFKDQVIFEADEITKPDGNPYQIYTPYSKKWHSSFNQTQCTPFDLQPYATHFATTNLKVQSMVTLEQMGFQKTAVTFPKKDIDLETVTSYTEQRDFPANEKGTSKLGLHLRFGTLSIRKVTRVASQHSPTWLNELIWRNFYMAILAKFPHVEHRAFKPVYDRIVWRHDEAQFDRWCQGQTGYPIVDAGMHQLNQTGFMHNRVRMITASFLCKHLLIDWRWGAQYFVTKLLDYDLAANNGGWQWASGSGCDAVPYFRIFNPSLQSKKFDPKSQYIQRWLPHYKESHYPLPIIEHKTARQRALDTYKKHLNG